MAYAQLPGAGLMLPHRPNIVMSGGFITNTLIDATGEKAAFVGRVFRKDRAGGDITKIGFRPGTVVSAGGSQIRVSLQTVSATAGPPGVPDETQDQTVDILLSALTSNTWHQSAALSANRTVTFGELLAVVFEFDAGGRLGADSLVCGGLDSPDGATIHQPGVRLKTGGAWANLAGIPNIALEFTDGVFGTFQGAFGPVSAFGSLNYNSGSALDEYALEFQVPWKCKVDGCWLWAFPDASGDSEVILYDGTSAMANGTRSLDNNSDWTNVSGMRHAEYLFDAEVELAANTTYRLAFKPTTANGVNLRYFDVATANHLQAHSGGTTFALTARVNAGAWDSPTTTRRPFMGLSFSSFDDGSGGGATFQLGMS